MAANAMAPVTIALGADRSLLHAFYEPCHRNYAYFRALPPALILHQTSLRGHGCLHQNIQRLPATDVSEAISLNRKKIKNNIN